MTIGTREHAVLATDSYMQQGGVELLMAVLIVSTPPMAAMFFNGTMGQFAHYSAFGGGMASRPGPQGQPPGAYGGRAPAPSTQNKLSPDFRQEAGCSRHNIDPLPLRTANTAQADAVKPYQSGPEVRV